MRGLAICICLLLAGCGGSAQKATQDLVVTSKLPEQEVTSDSSPPPPISSARGHIAGYVISENRTPIEGATVRVPGLDLERITDRDGGFGFVDLREGLYYVTVEAVGYYGTDVEVTVKAETFSRIKFILTPIPPPEPFHHTQVFRGFADVGAGPIFAVPLCSGCDIRLYIDGTPEVVLFEAVMDEPQTSGGNGFGVQLSPEDSYGNLYYGSLPNPARIEWRQDILQGQGIFDLYVYPEALVPETNKAFEVFVTAFYNGPPPAGWSVLNGDA